MIGPGGVRAGARPGDPGEVLQRQQAASQGDHRRADEAEGPDQGDATPGGGHLPGLRLSLLHRGRY